MQFTVTTDRHAFIWTISFIRSMQHIFGGGGYFCFWSTIPYDWTAVIPEYSSRIYWQAAFCMNVTLSICILLSPEQCSRTMNYFPVISTLLTLMITCELFHHKEVKNLLLNTCMKNISSSDQIKDSKLEHKNKKDFSYCARPCIWVKDCKSLTVKSNKVIFKQIQGCWYFMNGYFWIFIYTCNNANFKIKEKVIIIFQHLHLPNKDLGKSKIRELLYKIKCVHCYWVILQVKIFSCGFFKKKQKIKEANNMYKWFA